MTCRFFNTVVICSFLLLCSKSNAQEAEKLFHEKYSKLSFVFQPARTTGDFSTAPNSYPTLVTRESTSMQFGFYYNFAQSGAFNFKTGIVAKEFVPTFDLIINKADIGFGKDFYLDRLEAVNAFAITIPIKAEYFKSITPNLNLIMGAGLSVNLYTGGGETQVTVEVSDNTTSKEIFFAKTKQDQITLSTDISAGLQYKANFGLIQLETFYSRNIVPYVATSNYVIYNLENSPDTFGMSTIDGSFYGLS